MRVLDLLTFGLSMLMLGAYFGRTVRPRRPIAVDTLRGITLLVAAPGLQAAARLAGASPDTVYAMFWIRTALLPVAFWLMWRGQRAGNAAVFAP